MIWSKIMSMALILYGHVDKECYWGNASIVTVYYSTMFRYLTMITS